MKKFPSNTLNSFHLPEILSDYNSKEKIMVIDS